MSADSIDAIWPGGSADICCLLTFQLIRAHMLDIYLEPTCLLFWDLTGLSRAEPPGVRKQSRPMGTGTELPLLASVNDMLSPAELQSAYKTRLVLPSAS